MGTATGNKGVQGEGAGRASAEDSTASYTVRRGDTIRTKNEKTPGRTLRGKEVRTDSFRRSAELGARERKPELISNELIKREIGSSKNYGRR